MDRLREGAADARNFLANIGKQRVCPGRSPAGESFQFAQRSGKRFTEAIQIGAVQPNRDRSTAAFDHADKFFARARGKPLPREVEGYRLASATPSLCRAFEGSQS